MSIEPQTPIRKLADVFSGFFGKALIVMASSPLSKTVMFVSLDGKLAGMFGVADPINGTRPEAIRELKEQGSPSKPTSTVNVAQPDLDRD